MNVIGIIPARMDSTRFPGKPLVKINGMPMVGHCYWRTAMALGEANTFVATCDIEIFNYISGIGGQAVMTGSGHVRATTRTAEALEIIERKSGSKFDLVLMIQGDEPLINPEVITSMVSSFEDCSVDIVNIMSRISELNAFEDKNNVKVVIDGNSNALYFSRQPIPSPWHGFNDIPAYMQTGIIGFRRQTLLSFNASKGTVLEEIESVDMNRVLENGGSIRMVLMDGKTVGVDVPSDLQQAEILMKNDPIVTSYCTIHD